MTGCIFNGIIFSKNMIYHNASIITLKYQQIRIPAMVIKKRICIIVLFIKTNMKTLKKISREN